MDRRHQDVAGQVVAELDDQLGQVGLPGGDPAASRASLSSISWVAIDLTLTTSSTPWRAGDVGDDLVGLGGVRGPSARWLRPRSATVLRLLEVAAHVASTSSLIGAPLPQLLPVGRARR